MWYNNSVKSDYRRGENNIFFAMHFITAAIILTEEDYTMIYSNEQKNNLRIKIDYNNMMKKYIGESTV